MKSTKYWMKAIIGDAAIAYLIYLWLFQGGEGAGNVALFVIWSLTILRILSCFVVDKVDTEKLWRPYKFTAYHIITDLAVAYVLAWFGYFATAGIVFVSLVLMEGARGSALEKKNQPPMEEKA